MTCEVVFLSLYSTFCCDWCEPFFFTFVLFTFTYVALYGPPKQLIYLISVLLCWILTLSTLCTFWFVDFPPSAKLAHFFLLNSHFTQTLIISFYWSFTLRRLWTLSFLLADLTHWVHFLHFLFISHSAWKFLFVWPLAGSLFCTLTLNSIFIDLIFCYALWSSFNLLFTYISFFTWRTMYGIRALFFLHILFIQLVHFIFLTF